jgi:hypothetical protein
MLFHKIREEQLRRWLVADRGVKEALTKKPAMQPRLVWAPYADVWDDDDSDQVCRFYRSLFQKAKEASKRLVEVQKQRERDEMEEDERQAR